MKKVIVILALVCSVFAVQAQTKVGHVNFSALVEMMPEADSIQAKLQTATAQWQQMLQDRELDYGKAVKELEAMSQNPATQKEVLEVRSQEVQKLAAGYQELQRKANESLQKQQQDLLAPLIEKVQTSITEVAKANGYSYIMDNAEGSGILYSSDSNDIMPLVKAKLGL